MQGRARTATTVAAALAVLAATAPAAIAEERIYAVPSNQYLNPSVAIDQGETLLFRNLDLQQHDVVAVDKPAGKPLFASPLVAPGGEALVVGADQLKGGSYAYLCSIHPFMRGTLVVTGAGAPAPPPPASDTRAPALSLKVVDTKVSAVRKARKLRVRVTVDESGNVQLAATTKSGKRTVTIARATQAVSKPGAVTVSMPLTKSGASALRGRSSAAVSVTGHATDAAGNAGHGSAKRTLKR
ncbi:MAG TPA: plastocyanin/azurin family copper-binding protein [Thermoleophilaceae bacterium]|jgi:plastocyanin